MDPTKELILSKLKINRILTANLANPYENIQFKAVKSSIKNLDGSVAIASDEIIVPEHWTHIASDVMVRNYFRRKGISKHLRKVAETGIYEWLSRSVPDERFADAESETVGETDARQVFDRLAGAWTYWGVKGGYFDTEQDARNFYDELRYMLAMQMAAPNSPQWFNTGLHWAYGINGKAQGHYYFDEALGRLEKSQSSYERPQPHACFIQSVHDDLVNDGGIMDLWRNEARLFKFGSGTGSNFSHIRGSGEPLAGGGYSSGLMSFLRIGDVAGGSIKSGGTTRRAAKMVILDIDHPDIEQFINWKDREGNKVMDLYVGSRLLKKHTDALSESFKTGHGLQEAVDAASADDIPDAYITRVLQTLHNGYDFEKPTFTLDWDSGAYQSVFGQNSNNSVRVTDAFLHAVEQDDDFHLRWRTDGRACKTLKARYLWDEVAKAAWSCADPGVQFDTTINSWNTCSNDDRINASNPCSEYMFLDDTACNLASLNLLSFSKATINNDPALSNLNKMEFDIAAYQHAVRLWTIVLEISVYMAQFPTQQIAYKSYEYRTLGLGYGNLGALLMQSGFGYDSEEGRSIAAGLTALMHGVSAATSIDLARCMGPFARYEANKECVMRVMKNHFVAAYGGPEALRARLANSTFASAANNESKFSDTGYYSHTVSAKSETQSSQDEYSIGFGANMKRDIAASSNYVEDYVNNFARYEGLNVEPVAFNRNVCKFDGLADAVEEVWEAVLQNGGKYGFRNAQLTVLAPTGTIGMVMDFKTTGVEPQFSHVAIKQLAGGGVWRLVNEDIAKALLMLGYTTSEIDEINKYVVGHASLNGPIALNLNWLMQKGFGQADINKVEENLKQAFSVQQAFARYALDEALFIRLGIQSSEYDAENFDLLTKLGATADNIKEANSYACGHMTIEGAPHIKQAHLPIFDCARSSGDGSRYLSWQSHVKMMAAAQPFISGAISKTINLQNDCAIADCEAAYMMAWKLCLKAVALYRDGSKYSQVLNTNNKNALDLSKFKKANKQVSIADAQSKMQPKVEQFVNEHANIIVEQEVKLSAISDIHQNSENIEQPEQNLDDKLFKPFRRRGYTQHVLIGGSSLWHTTGEDDNGRLRNLLLTYGKEGSTLRGWASAWGRILSMYLQDKGDSALVRVYKAFRHSKFEPMGEVQGHPYIKHATSIPDYIVEDLVVAYPDMLNAPFSPSSLPPERHGTINKVRIGSETMYMIIGEDIHGRPAEIFVSGIGNEGSDLRGWMNSCAKLISLYFQDCGEAAIWQFINAFEGSSFEPAGFVEGTGLIKFATSPLDFLAKHLRMTYSNVLLNQQTVLPLANPVATNPIIQMHKQDAEQGQVVASCQISSVTSEVEPVKQKDENIELKIRAMSGYKVDEPCRSCRAFKLRYNGTCYICDNCFTTTGCSG